jgi:dTDP-4-amino-4,6-dideoxygalactose transaminase
VTAVDGDPYIVFGSPIIGRDEIDAVVRTLETGWIGTGPRVQEFEQQVASYTRARHAVAVGSGTAALHLSMVAAGLGPGDEVITTPLTFAATAAAILHAGATPVFADVERDTLNIDPDAAAAAVTPRTRAIVPVHLAGRPCDLDRIAEIARAAGGLLVIEDAAHALEAAYRGRKIGSISPLTCFSFYVTKNITTGEGGLVTCADESLANRIKVLALHGLDADAWKRFGDEGYRHYEVVAPGFKYNMTDLQASLGLAQLPKVSGWLARREAIWAHYDAAFAGLPLWTPRPPEPDTIHARHLYTPLLDIDTARISRDELLARLHARGIGTGVHYRSLHLHDYYRRRFGFEPDQFPNARWISDRTFSLPLSAKLGDADVARIVTAVTEILLS